MARATGISATTVHRIWGAFGLQPHRVESFKLSSDPEFIGKMRDIVGLYLDPPDRALVLCIDEKSQIQALDRTQPMLPMRGGAAQPRLQAPRHDHPVRRPRHRHRRGHRELHEAASGARVPLVPRRGGERRARRPRHPCLMDNASSHKTRLIQDWFAKRPRWHRHSPRHPRHGSTRSSASSPGATDQARRPQIDRRAGIRHRALYRNPQPRSPSVPMDQIRRRHPGFHPTLLPKDTQRPYRSG